MFLPLTAHHKCLTGNHLSPIQKCFLPSTKSKTVPSTASLLQGRVDITNHQNLVWIKHRTFLVSQEFVVRFRKKYLAVKSLTRAGSSELNTEESLSSSQFGKDFLVEKLAKLSTKSSTFLHLQSQIITEDEWSSFLDRPPILGFLVYQNLCDQPISLCCFQGQRNDVMVVGVEPFSLEGRVPALVTTRQSDIVQGLSNQRFGQMQARR